MSTPNRIDSLVLTMSLLRPLPPPPPPVLAQVLSSLWNRKLELGLLKSLSWAGSSLYFLASLEGLGKQAWRGRGRDTCLGSQSSTVNENEGLSYSPTVILKPSILETTGHL